MDSSEASERTDAIRKLANDVREHLYHMYTRKGWAALGYESWQQYLVGEFEVSHSYLRRQTHAGMLEAEIGAELGTYKESHLRPVNEMLELPQLRVMAIKYVHARHKSPVARDFKDAAMEVYLRYASANPVLVNRFENGDVPIGTAYEIAKFLEGCDPSTALYHVATQVSDTEMLPILKRLSENSRSTWDEIVMTWHIPSYPDQIHISKATAGALLAYLDVASNEHRAQAIESKREFYALKGELTDKIVEAARDVVKRSNANSLNVLAIYIIQLDKLESDED